MSPGSSPKGMGPWSGPPIPVLMSPGGGPPSAVIPARASAGTSTRTKSSAIDRTTRVMEVSFVVGQSQSVAVLVEPRIVPRAGPLAAQGGLDGGQVRAPDRLRELLDVVGGEDRRGERLERRIDRA